MSSRIRMEIDEAGLGRVWLNDHEISSSTQSISFSAGPGQLTVVTLKVLANVNLVAENMSYIPEAQLPPNSPLPGR